MARRLIEVKVAYAVLGDILKGRLGRVDVISSLPQDAEVVRVHEHPGMGVECFSVWLESEGFSEVQEGSHPPTVDVVFTRKG